MKSTDIPMDGNVENILYQFAAAEFEWKAGNDIDVLNGYMLQADGDTDASERRKMIENKYMPDTFTGFLTSLLTWISDGAWDECRSIEEIKKKYVKVNIPPEQRFIHWWFWDLQQEDIDIGMPRVLEKAYDSKVSRDELMALLEKIHVLKVHETPLPCEVKYNKIKDGLEKRKKEIKEGRVIEPERHTFPRKTDLDSEASVVYDEIELLDNQLYAWEIRNMFISYLNDENTVSYYNLKNKYIDSFDKEIISSDTDKMSIAISNSFLKLLEEKIVRISETFQN